MDTLYLHRPPDARILLATATTRRFPRFRTRAWEKGRRTGGDGGFGSRGVARHPRGWSSSSERAPQASGRLCVRRHWRRCAWPGFSIAWRWGYTRRYLQLCGVSSMSFQGVVVGYRWGNDEGRVARLCVKSASLWMYIRVVYIYMCVCVYVCTSRSWIKILGLYYIRSLLRYRVVQLYLVKDLVRTWAMVRMYLSCIYNIYIYYMYIYKLYIIYIYIYIFCSWLKLKLSLDCIIFDLRCYFNQLYLIKSLVPTRTMVRGQV